jgi:hypothetical protein
MANVTITQLPQAGAITGQELVPVVQNGQTVQTTTAAISASPSQTQTFLTVNQEATLINSRALSGGTGIGLTDGGALSTLQINLNAVSGSLESSGVGLIAKTGGTVTGRTLVAGTSGLSITNGNGVSGNPSISLTGALAGIPGLAGTGLISIIGGSTASQVTILGTANQITVVNGNGNGNPTISIARRSNATRHRRGSHARWYNGSSDLEARQGRYDLTPTPALWSITPGLLGLICKQGRQLLTTSPVDCKPNPGAKRCLADRIY